MKWYFVPWQKYADFTGRARRKEYWTFTLINMAVIVPLLAINVIRDTPISQITGILLIIVPAVIVPSWAVLIRRLHDTNRSGSYFIYGQIPIVGTILLTIWLCQDSDPEENKYGPNPKFETGNHK